MEQIRVRPDTDDRPANGVVDVREAAERVVRLRTRLRDDAGAQRGLVGPVQPAVRMVHEHDFARLEQALREHQRAQHVNGGKTAGVAQHVCLARAEAEDTGDVDARIHAGHDRDPHRRDGRPRSAELSPFGVRVGEQSVDHRFHDGQISAANGAALEATRASLAASGTVMEPVMPLPLSILDQSPIVAGATPRDAVAATIALAREAETLGYHRYWLAEHHALPSLADASPEVLLARLTGETSRIRLGSGGIMLPHYSAFKVAETFRMLDALAPGRIDLGVGRAPGGTRLVSQALESRDPELFPQQIADVLAYTSGAGEGRRALVAQPAGATAPAMWVLGSSAYGAQVAAQFGLPYTYAQFIGGDYPEVPHAYRARFVPSAHAERPYVMVALAAIVAPTDAEAERLALPALLSRLRRLRGVTAPLPSLAEAEAYPWTPLERDEIIRSRNMIIGSPSTARARIDAVAENYGADEVMVVTIAPDYATRTQSYALLAEAFAAVAA